MLYVLIARTFILYRPSTLPRRPSLESEETSDTAQPLFLAGKAAAPTDADRAHLRIRAKDLEQRLQHVLGDKGNPRIQENLILCRTLLNELLHCLRQTQLRILPAHELEFVALRHSEHLNRRQAGINLSPLSFGNKNRNPMILHSA